MEDLKDSTTRNESKRISLLMHYLISIDVTNWSYAWWFIRCYKRCYILFTFAHVCRQHHIIIHQSNRSSLRIELFLMSHDLFRRPRIHFIASKSIAHTWVYLENELYYTHTVRVCNVFLLVKYVLDFWLFYRPSK